MNFFNLFTKKLFELDWALSFSGFLYEAGLAVFFSVLLLAVLFIVLELGRKKYPASVYVAAIVFCGVPWYGGAIWVVVGLMLFSLLFGRHGGRVVVQAVVGLTLSIVLLASSASLAQFLGSRQYPILQALFTGVIPAVVWPHEHTLILAKDPALRDIEKYAVGVQARLTGALTEAEEVLSSLDGEEHPYVLGEKANLMFLRGEHEKAQEAYQSILNRKIGFQAEAHYNISKTQLELLFSDLSSQSIEHAQKLNPQMVQALQDIEQREGIGSPRAIATFMPDTVEVVKLLFFREGFLKRCSEAMSLFTGKIPVFAGLIALAVLLIAGIFKGLSTPPDKHENPPALAVYLLVSIFPGAFLLSRHRTLIPFLTLTTFCLASLGYLRTISEQRQDSPYVWTMAAGLVILSFIFAIVDRVNSTEKKYVR